MKISQRAQLRPSQLRTVADRRFDDARALLRTKENARANGAIYLAGFVVECLLKAALLEEYPWLRNASSPDGLSRENSRLWSLCYRLHNLDEILARLPKVLEEFSQVRRRGSNQPAESLKYICAQWTVYMRYSPHSEDIDTAATFINRVKEVREWLR